MDSPTIRYLEMRLQSCLAEEDYEQAARLRDRIKQLRDPGPDYYPNPGPGPLGLHPTAVAPSQEEIRRTNDLEDSLRWDVRKLKEAGDRGLLHGELMREQLMRMHRNMRDAIWKALEEQVALHFPGLLLDPYTMRGQGFILTDHRTDTEEYHFRGKLLLVVDRSVLPWRIMKV